MKIRNISKSTLYFGQLKLKLAPNEVIDLKPDEYEALKLFINRWEKLGLIERVSESKASKQSSKQTSIAVKEEKEPTVENTPEEKKSSDKKKKKKGEA